MAKPIIHIGLHKTATSWLQKHVYPQVTSHRYVDRVLVRRTLLEGSAFDFDVEASRAALGFDRPGPPPLLCDEDLSGFMHLGRTSGFVAKDVAQRLHALSPDAQIMIFVRAQAAMIAGAYLQYLREGGTHSARAYVFPDEYRHPGKYRPFKLRGFSFEQFRYHELIAHYDALFGRQNVHVYLYEELNRNQQAMLERVAADTGMTLPARIEQGKRVNAGYRMGVIPIARVLNCFTNRSIQPKKTLVHIPYWYPVRKRVLEALSRLPLFGAKPKPDRLLGRQVLDWIGQAYWEDNRRLAERIGRDIAPFGYAVEAPAGPVTKPKRTKLLRWMRN